MAYIRVFSFLVLMVLLPHSAALAADTNPKLMKWVFGNKTSAATKHSALVVDRASRGCLQCHDGSIAGHAANTSSGSSTGFSDLLARSHPIGMDYRHTVQRKPFEYKQSTDIDPRITLVDGRVSCISCHAAKPDSSQIHGTQTANTEPKPDCGASGQLTVTNRFSKLCLSCHAM